MMHVKTRQNENEKRRILIVEDEAINREMLAMVLQSVGLPLDGIALVAGVDRIFDMGRTTVNITGDASCTMIVSYLLRNKIKSWTDKDKEAETA